MKQKINSKEANVFISDMLRAYSQSIEQESPSPSPFFMSKLQARLRERQTVTQFWETGVIKAQRWLVAFSLIAIFCLVGNVILKQTSVSVQEDLAPESLALGDHEWDHLSDYPQLRETSKP